MVKKMDNHNPMKKEIESLIEENKSLKAQLKERDMQIEQEVIYKMEERKKWEALSNEIHQVKKQLGFYIAFNKDGKEKIFELIKEVLKFYGEKLEQKKPH
jgi:regulator of replication initiation timing